MAWTAWKYFDQERKSIFRKDLETGSVESCLPTQVPSGTVIQEPDAPVLTQDELDAAVARDYQKLRALRNMTPAQVIAWVDANVTTQANVIDAIKTLAIAVSILSRRL